MVYFEPGNADVPKEMVGHVPQSLQAQPPLPPAEENVRGTLDATFITQPEQGSIPIPSKIFDHHHPRILMEHSGRVRGCVPWNSSQPSIGCEATVFQAR
jgi:hypothetical protein